jgi:hypothetical protein
MLGLLSVAGFQRREKFYATNTPQRFIASGNRFPSNIIRRQ